MENLDPNSTQTPTPIPQNNGPSRKKVLFAILGIIFLVSGAYYFSAGTGTQGSINTRKTKPPVSTELIPRGTPAPLTQTTTPPAPTAADIIANKQGELKLKLKNPQISTSIADKSVLISISDATPSDIINTYKIYRANPGNTASQEMKTQYSLSGQITVHGNEINSSKAMSFTDSSVEPEQEYTYTAVAFINDPDPSVQIAAGTISNTSTIKIPKPAPSAADIKAAQKELKLKLKTPQISTSIDGKSVLISINDATPSDIINTYKIMRADSSNNNYQKLTSLYSPYGQVTLQGIEIISTKEKNFIDSNVKPNTEYSYSVATFVNEPDPFFVNGTAGILSNISTITIPEAKEEVPVVLNEVINTVQLPKFSVPNVSSTILPYLRVYFTWTDDTAKVTKDGYEVDPVQTYRLTRSENPSSLTQVTTPFGTFNTFSEVIDTSYPKQITDQNIESGKTYYYMIETMSDFYPNGSGKPMISQTSAIISVTIP